MLTFCIFFTFFEWFILFLIHYYFWIWKTFLQVNCSCNYFIDFVWNVLLMMIQLLYWSCCECFYCFTDDDMIVLDSNEIILLILLLLHYWYIFHCFIDILSKDIFQKLAVSKDSFYYQIFEYNITYDFFHCFKSWINWY